MPNEPYIIETVGLTADGWVNSIPDPPPPPPPNWSIREPSWQELLLSAFKLFLEQQRHTTNTLQQLGDRDNSFNNQPWDDPLQPLGMQGPSANISLWQAQWIWMLENDNPFIRDVDGPIGIDPNNPKGRNTDFTPPIVTDDYKYQLSGVRVVDENGNVTPTTEKLLLKIKCALKNIAERLRNKEEREKFDKFRGCNDQMDGLIDCILDRAPWKDMIFKDDPAMKTFQGDSLMGSYMVYNGFYQTVGPLQGGEIWVDQILVNTYQMNRRANDFPDADLAWESILFHELLHKCSGDDSNTEMEEYILTQAIYGSVYQGRNPKIDSMLREKDKVEKFFHNGPVFPGNDPDSIKNEQLMIYSKHFAFNSKTGEVYCEGGDGKWRKIEDFKFN